MINEEVWTELTLNEKQKQSLLFVVWHIDFPTYWPAKTSDLKYSVGNSRDTFDMIKLADQSRNIPELALCYQPSAVQCQISENEFTQFITI